MGGALGDQEHVAATGIMDGLSAVGPAHGDCATAGYQHQKLIAAIMAFPAAGDALAGPHDSDHGGPRDGEAGEDVWASHARGPLDLRTDRKHHLVLFRLIHLSLLCESLSSPFEYVMISSHFLFAFGEGRWAGRV
jgi:hypothetical protein